MYLLLVSAPNKVFYNVQYVHNLHDLYTGVHMSRGDDGDAAGGLRGTDADGTANSGLTLRGRRRWNPQGLSCNNITIVLELQFLLTTKYNQI